jgi:YidC/Oxa1 family membrane protein insertase
MPATKPNQVFRVVIPLILIAAVVGLTVLAFASAGRSRNGSAQRAASGQSALASPSGEAGAGAAATDTTTDTTANTTAEPAASGAAVDPAPAIASEPAADSAASGLAAIQPVDGGEVSTWRARVQPADPMPVLGSLDPASGFELQVSLSSSGAGVERILATRHYLSVADRLSPPDQREHYVIQARSREQTPFGTIALTPFATRTLLIGDKAIDLHGSPSEPLWRVVEATPRSAVLEAQIVDAENQPALTIRKSYRLDEGQHQLLVAHTLTNHTGRSLEVRWVHQGPIDMPSEQGGAYGGAVMRMRFGYLLKPKDDPTQTYVEADTKLLRTAQVVTQIQKALQKNQPDADVVWPDSGRFEIAGPLVWFAQCSRYFATAVFPDYQPGAGQGKALPAQTLMGTSINQRLLSAMWSPASTVAAGGTQALSYRVFAGPISRESLSADAHPAYAPGELNLRGLLVYNYGGPCSACTFQWLASPLLTVLRVFHGFTGDWAVSIIMLVIVVRSLLHPITRKSQISMLRFGKQMQKIAPKQQKIRERYKNDPKQMQTEMAKLMREEGVNPVGMLGCLPMFLQTPVWFALYAMLGFAIELRHEPAFYGLFQTLTGNRWSFLADLSVADAFIPFGTTFNVPLLSGLMGPIGSINILPLLLGVVFFIQQKYLTPPTSATMTPEQEAQQKMIKVMMVVMFPVFIYNAPSGLAVYFITNSTIAIFESRWIRKSAEKMDLDKPSRTAELLRKQVENRAAKMNLARAGKQARPAKADRSPKRFKDR